MTTFFLGDSGHQFIIIIKFYDEFIKVVVNPRLDNGIPLQLKNLVHSKFSFTTHGIGNTVPRDSNNKVSANLT
jgi:hypothetical protein